jgi:transcriptional regulator with XRE-family HTH domain
MSQSELADAARTTQSAVSRIERNRLNPSVGTLERLVEATGARLVMATER